MKTFLALVLAAISLSSLGGCANTGENSIASSGRSGCNNINMAAVDIRNDPANGLPPTPGH